MSDFGKVCPRRTFNIKMLKSVGMKSFSTKGQEPRRMRLKGWELEEVKQFKYLELVVCAREEKKVRMSCRLNEGDTWDAGRHAC